MESFRFCTFIWSLTQVVKDWGELRGGFSFNFQVSMEMNRNKNKKEEKMGKKPMRKIVWKKKQKMKS